MILHVIGRLAPYSVPLQVASAMSDAGIDVRVAGRHRPEDANPLAIGFTRAMLGIVKGQFRAVHCHHGRQALPLALLARARGLPVVATQHSLLSTGLTWAKVSAMARLSLSTSIVCNSQATMDSLPDRYHRRCRVVYNAVDLIPGSHEAGPSRDVDIVYVGRLEPIKQLHRLLDVVGHVVEALGTVRVVIAGDGSQAAELLQRVDDELSGVVCLAGTLDRSGVHELLARSRMFVSMSSSEGFGNAVVEAMSAGCAVRVLDVGAMAEVVPPQSLLDADSSSGEVAKSIVAALQQPGGVTDEGSTNRSSASSFSIERHLARLASVYGHDLIDG
ncbi:MAG: glycosyltransferase family 4 protein [Actinomycetia bacterium]|nr:glycosyltransferase family 4 protein [Actinomycetes bacterium]MCP4227829.1 glycosyltransferase family 4 protein [Actinomycetes bacterium]MCP5031066.1 glycosyltransferase family 4 protein [Actinomycetes bacterium]